MVSFSSFNSISQKELTIATQYEFLRKLDKTPAIIWKMHMENDCSNSSIDREYSNFLSSDFVAAMRTICNISVGIKSSLISY